MKLEVDKMNLGFAAIGAQKAMVNLTNALLKFNARTEALNIQNEQIGKKK